MNPANVMARRAARPGEEFSAGRMAGLLALLVVLAFPQVALGLQSFVIRDFGFFAYPLAYFQRECFWRGELPLWNPYNACGVPFLAQWNTMPLYPPALLYLLLPLTWGLNLFCLLHLWFGGLGAFVLARRWTGHGAAAAFAGVAFAFNGMTLNLLMWPSHIATFAWMPWVVLAVERAWLEGGRRVLWAAVAGAMQMLAGGPETILLTWLLLTALWAGEVVRARNRPRAGTIATEAAGGEGARRPSLWRMALRFPCVAMLVFLLAAAQLLPFLHLAAHSEREVGYADTRWSMPARGVANFLVPMAFGHVSSLGFFVQHQQGWTSSYYPGMSVLLLALLTGVALLRRGANAPAATGAATEAARWRAGVLGIGALAALLLAMGDQTFFYRALRAVVPQLSLMTYPVKFLLAVTFALPLLAAFALARLLPGGGDAARPDASQRQTAPAGSRFEWIDRCGVGLLVSLGLVVVWAWRSPAPGEEVRLTAFSALSRAAFLIATGTLLLAVTRAGRPALVRLTPWALLFLVWLDLLTHQPTQNPTTLPWVYEPGLARVKLGLRPEPALGESRALVAPEAARRFREIVLASPADNFIVKRLGLFADCNLLDALPKVDGFFSLYPRRSGEVISALYGTTNLACSGLLDFLAVSQVSAPGEDLQWQPRATHLPWITGGQQPVFLDDPAALGALFRADFDPRRFVLLPPDAAKALGERPAAAPVRVRNVRCGLRQVQFEAEADAPALVVVAQTWYPWWQARLDGQRVPLLRANYAFQALEVPPGAHRVELRYEDAAFRIGAGLSALAWLGCVVGFLARKRAGVAENPL
jgi:hypothetical protein